jgi:hypothetical protein
MFTALILACNVSFTECKTFMFPDMLNTEDSCMTVIGAGISQIESSGLFVKDYQCVVWGTDT